MKQGFTMNLGRLFVTALLVVGSGVVGLAIGAVTIPLVSTVIAPAWKAIRPGSGRAEH